MFSGEREERVQRQEVSPEVQDADANVQVCSNENKDSGKTV
jgi:hypothetical protein